MCESEAPGREPQATGARWTEPPPEAEAAAAARDLVACLALAERDERRRLAAALHDDLQQLLFGVRLKLAMVRQRAHQGDQDRAGREAAEAEELVDEALEKMRWIAGDLMAEADDDESPGAALERTCADVEAHGGAEVTIRGAALAGLVEEGMRALLLRTLRQLLRGAAGPTSVDLSEEDGGLVVEVALAPGDEPSASASSELAHLQRRLRLVGASLAPSSGSDGVRRMTLRIPAPPEPSPGKPGRP